jgi:hypothetical protein
MGRIVEEMAPQLFDSFRSFLQASPEQRREERRPYLHPVHVYPVFPDLDLGDLIEGTGKNLSSGGIGFRVSQVPPVEQFYLHFPSADWVRDFALLARLVRIRPAEGGGHEVAATFPGQHRPVPASS